MAGFAPATEAGPDGQPGPDPRACAAGGGPNPCIIVGENGVVVVDARAMSAMAQDVMGRIGAATDRKATRAAPARRRAARVPGASGRGAHRPRASDAGRARSATRAKPHAEREFGRCFPRPFLGGTRIPGVARLTHSKERETSLPLERAPCTGGAVEAGAAPRRGEAHRAERMALLRDIRRNVADRARSGSRATFRIHLTPDASGARGWTHGIDHARTCMAERDPEMRRGTGGAAPIDRADPRG